MQLFFCSETPMEGMFGRPVILLESIKNDSIVLGKSSAKHPPLSVKQFRKLPDATHVIYNIFSLDCSIDSDGMYENKKISESDALSLIQKSVVYKCDEHMTPYFRYKIADKQHTVWLEDTKHQIQKLSLLESFGIESVGLVINNISVGTVINLVHTNRYRI